MTTDTLLPPNSSVSERSLETALRPGVAVKAGAALIRTAKEDVPDGWPYWLVWEYGLEELLPYLPDPRVVLQQGLQWQRIRGTPASLHMAHAWVGLGSALVEEEIPTGRHWFEYQLNPGMQPTPEQLANLVGLSRLSAPIGTRLSRVYFGLDQRRAIYDETAWSDGTLYSDHGGIWDSNLGVILSFGRTHQSVGSGDMLADVFIYVQHSRSYATVARYVDRDLWDNTYYGDGPPIRNYQTDLEREIDVIGQGVGRNILIADGGYAAGATYLLANGQWTANGGQTSDGVTTFGQQIANGAFRANGRRPELPQIPVNHITQDYTTQSLGWGAASWTARTWTQPA